MHPDKSRRHLAMPVIAAAAVITLAVLTFPRRASQPPMRGQPSAPPDRVASRSIPPPRTRDSQARNEMKDDLARLKQSAEVQALLRDSRNTLLPAKSEEGLGVRTSKFRHFHNGIEVIGSTAMMHHGPAGEQIQLNLANVDVNTQPDIPASKAAEIARGILRASAPLLNPPELKILPSKDLASGTLIYIVKLAPQNGTPPAEVWIDAHSGELVANVSRSGFKKG